MKTPFFGASYKSLSSNLSNSRCMNLIPEIVETKEGKQSGAFYSTPGLRKLASIANGGKGVIRGLHFISATNKALIVCGNTITLMTQNLVQSVIGTLSTMVGNVSIIDNGSQYAFSDGQSLYVYASGALTKITSIPPNPGILTYQDGFGLVSITGTNQFYQSNLNDLTTWDPLNYSSADSEPSPISYIISMFRQLWIFKQRSVEVWNNAGLNGFAFQRMQGVFLETGCAAPYSVSKVADKLVWLGNNEQGQGVINSTNGYSAERLSTHAVEYAIQSYPKINDAISYAYQQNGHLYYVITFPSGNATWVYDVTTKLWHERGEFLNGKYNAHDSNGQIVFAGKNVVGSLTSTQIYSLDILYPTDDLISNPTVCPKRWARRWRAVQEPSNVPVRFPALQIDMQTGVTLGA